MAVKFIALVVLIFSIKCEAKEETENSLDRLLSADCENSEPFFIKNEKKRKSYLTADPGTGAVKGWTKTGKASQQWMWSHCDQAIHLVNVATGGCLTQEGSVSEECLNDIFWEPWDIAHIDLIYSYMHQLTLPYHQTSTMVLHLDKCWADEHSKTHGHLHLYFYTLQEKFLVFARHLMETERPRETM